MWFEVIAFHVSLKSVIALPTLLAATMKETYKKLWFQTLKNEQK